MSSNKTSRQLIKNILKINIGCGCGRPKLTDIIQPKPKSKTFMIRKMLAEPACPYSSSSRSWDRNGGLSISMDDEDYTSTTISLNNNIDDTSPLYYPKPQNNPQASKIGESIAVVKDSDDPYRDFRHSMLQMITEKEIYSRDDLHELLKCFLELNSTDQHGIIVQAFMEIWNNIEGLSRQGRS